MVENAKLAPISSSEDYPIIQRAFIKAGVAPVSNKFLKQKKSNTLATIFKTISNHIKSRNTV